MLGMERRLAPLGNTFLDDSLPSGMGKLHRSNSFSGYRCYRHELSKMEPLEPLRGEDASEATSMSQNRASPDLAKMRRKPAPLTVDSVRLLEGCAFDSACCKGKSGEGCIGEPLTPSTCESTPCLSMTELRMTPRLSCSSLGSSSGQEKMEEFGGFCKESCEGESTKVDHMQDNQAPTMLMDKGHAAGGAALAAHGGEPGPKHGGCFETKRQRRELPDGVTTLKVYQLPACVRQMELAHELDKSGFAGLYDFLYVPVRSYNGKQAYAIVNFVTHDAAQRYIDEWRARRFFRVGNDTTVSAVLHMSPARLQGWDANMSKWLTPKQLRKVKPYFRPFFIQKPNGNETQGNDMCPQVPGVWEAHAES